MMISAALASSVWTRLSFASDLWLFPLAIGALLAFYLLLHLHLAMHEVGHLLAIRYFKLTATKVSLGTGPRLWCGHDSYGTVWSVKALPFSGYVSHHWRWGTGHRPGRVADLVISAAGHVGETVFVILTAGGVVLGYVIFGPVLPLVGHVGHFRGHLPIVLALALSFLPLVIHLFAVASLAYGISGRGKADEDGPRVHAALSGMPGWRTVRGFLKWCPLAALLYVAWASYFVTRHLIFGIR